MNRPLPLSFLVLALASGCASLGIVPDMVHVVDALDAARLIQNGAFILDVNPPDDFEQGYIQEAHSIPYSRLWIQMDELPENKERLILICDTFGKRSHRAAILLKEEGYRNIYDLKGGLAAWTATGLPLVRSSALPPSS